jgi:hypothetical protein
VLELVDPRDAGESGFVQLLAVADEGLLRALDLGQG